MKKIVTLATLLFLTVSILFSQEQQAAANDREVIVQLEKGVSPVDFFKKTEAAQVEPLGLHFEKTLSERIGAYLFSFQKKMAAADVQAILQQQPGVVATQLNPRLQFRGDSIPNDPLWSTQWDMEMIELPKVWGITTGGKTPDGKEIVIALLDKGIDLNHEDLVGNFWTNPGEIPDDGLDNDDNDFADDVHGYNFRFGGIPNITLETHGTWVAGNLAAQGNNGIGPAGVNWNVKIMFLGVDLSSEVILAFEYIIQMRELYNATNGAKGAYIVVTNGSFGIDKTHCEQQPIWGAFYDPMGELGILSVAATANEDWNVDELGDVPTTCPSEYLIAVTNTTIEDEKFSAAGYGKLNIDLGAPGHLTTTTNTLNRYKEDFRGTSSACPHVAGTIALLYSLPCNDFSELATTDPAQAARVMRDAILKGTDPNPTLQGKTATGGRLNAYGAMKYLHSFCVARTEERSAGDFQEIYFDEKNLVRLFPNPTSDELVVEYSNEDFTEYAVQVFNALGQLVIPAKTVTTKPFEKQQIVLDVSDLALGTYFVSMVGNKEKVTMRFVKQ